MKNSLKLLKAWIKEEPITLCPHCRKRYSIPGVDASKYRDCGWIEHRTEQVRQYCLSQNKKKISQKFDPNNLTEAQAERVLLALAPTLLKREVQANG